MLNLPALVFHNSASDQRILFFFFSNKERQQWVNELEISWIMYKHNPGAADLIEGRNDLLNYYLRHQFEKTFYRIVVLSLG